MRRAWRGTLLAVGLLAACDLGAALTGRANVVARAGPHELTVDALAAALAGAERLPVRRDIAARWAHHWVEYVLFAERIAAGDSLLDSATVVRAMWPDVDQILVNEYHAHLVDDRLRLDAAAVDSAYAAGAHRLIHHILIRTPPDMAPPAREAARRRAEAIRARLAAGGSWEEANRVNEDPVARQAGGSLGVIARGQVPELDPVAFVLAPGELSEVTQTTFGYHVLRRPRLETVRAEYREAIEDQLIQGMDSVFLDELERRRDVTVRASAPALIRDAASNPLPARDSRRVLGSYRGGRFTVADFVRWLQALPPVIHQQALTAEDAQLTEFARSLVRNQALIAEAREWGARLPDSAYATLVERHRREVGDVRRALALDSALAGVEGREARRRAARAAADAYLARVMATLKDAVVVPPFLAEVLREEAGADVSTVGVDQVVERAEALRQQAAGVAAAGTTSVGDTATEEEPDR